MIAVPSWFSPLLVVLGMIFSAGITWGVINYRQKKGEDSLSALVKELKEVVNKLQTLFTEVEVIKASSVRTEALTMDHTHRITQLEIQVGKLTSRRKA
jgi:hypothetical protein